jgi:hypothetical protein
MERASKYAPCTPVGATISTASRAEITERCTGSDTKVLNHGDEVVLHAGGLLRLRKVTAPGAPGLEVVCQNPSAQPVSLKAHVSAPAWLAPAAGNTMCGGWDKDELSCMNATGDEPLVCTRFEVAPTIVVEAGKEDQESLRRIAVYELETSDVNERWAPIVTAGLVQEIRKLQGVSVIGMDEVRAMLDHEAQRQLAGCDADSDCLAEIAGALGADTLVVGGMARVGDEHVLSLRAIEPQAAEVSGTWGARFPAENGEEFLVALGPAVEKLFPEHLLLPGKERGPAKEFGFRLNPPPLPPWGFWSAVSLTAAAGVVTTALGAGFAWAFFEFDRLNHLPERRQSHVNEARQNAELLLNPALVAGGFTLALGLATGFAYPFTDFEGYAEAE